MRSRSQSGLSPNSKPRQRRRAHSSGSDEHDARYPKRPFVEPRPTQWSNLTLEVPNSSNSAEDKATPPQASPTYQAAWVQTASGKAMMLLVPKPLLISSEGSPSTIYRDAACQTDQSATMIFDHHGRVKIEN